MTEKKLYDGETVPGRCIANVRADTRWPRWHQCRFKQATGPWSQFCRTHDPDRVAKREAASRLLRDSRDPYIKLRKQREYSDNLEKVVGVLQEAVMDFILKVERGEARSTRSYAKFKAAVAQVNTLQRP